MSGSVSQHLGPAYSRSVQAPQPKVHAAGIIEGQRKGVGFIVDDPELCPRTCLINFDAFAALYSATDAPSPFCVSLCVATRVRCSDWVRRGGDPNPFSNDAYNSPLITDDRTFLRPRCGEGLGRKCLAAKKPGRSRAF